MAKAPTRASDTLALAGESHTFLHTVTGKKTAPSQLRGYLYLTIPPVKGTEHDHHRQPSPPLKIVFFPACFQWQADGLISLECCPLV